MPVSGKVLEDSIRLSRIRRTKIALYTIQAVMLIALGFLVVFVFGDASLRPVLFLPLNSFIAVVTLLLLMLCVESFFFRVLEIRFARSSSAKHLMAKNSIKQAALIVAVTGMLAVTLAVPAVRGAIENTATTTMVVNRYTEAPAFYSSDVFAMMGVTQVKVTAPSDVQVYLLEDSVYNQYSKNMSAYYTFRLNTDNYNVGPRQPTVISVPAERGYVKYRLVLNDMQSPDTSAMITVKSQMSSTFTGLVSLLMIAFVVANAAWIAYLIPIERRYSVGSIYR